MDLTGLIIFGGFFAFMYFFIIRPQQQRQKAARDLMAALAVGDDVVTIGGLHGQITAVEEKSVGLRISDGVEVTFEKVAIAARRDDSAAGEIG